MKQGAEKKLILSLPELACCGKLFCFEHFLADGFQGWSRERMPARGWETPF
jgi:hypothetical protein